MITHVGEQIHDRCSAEHDHNGDAEGEFQGFVDSLFLLGAVVVGQDGDQSVVEAEDRHEEEALQLEVDAEDSCSSRGEGGQDHIHAVGHDGADGHHEDGRHADNVNTADRVKVGTKDPAPAETDVGVELQVHDKAQ